MRLARHAWSLRLAALVGLLAALPVAAWWLGGTRLALAQGADTARLSAAALQLLWLLRALALPVLALRIGALDGARAATVAAMAALAPAWPVAALAWSASPVPASALWRAEALLVAGALTLPWVGAAVRGLLPRPAQADAAATGLAVAMAATVWAHGAGFGPAQG